MRKEFDHQLLKEIFTLYTHHTNSAEQAGGESDQLAAISNAICSKLEMLPLPCSFAGEAPSQKCIFMNRIYEINRIIEQMSAGEYQGVVGQIVHRDQV